MKKFAVAALIASVFCSGAAFAESNDDKDSSAPKPAWEIAKKQSEQQKQGKFSTCYPNPFELCSHPRPDKHHQKLRDCWDDLCKD